MTHTNNLALDPRSGFGNKKSPFVFEHFVYRSIHLCPIFAKVPKVQNYLDLRLPSDVKRGALVRV